MTRRSPFIVAASSLIGVLAACGSDQRTLTLAVSAEEPAPAIAGAVQATLQDNGFDVSIESVTDPVEPMLWISNRQFDLAIVEEPDRTRSGVMTLAPMYPSVLHILHKRSPAPTSLVDVIRGANIYAGPPGGAGDRLLAELARDFDVADDEFKVLEYPWPIVPDVYFVFGGLLSRDSIAELRDYRLFSLGAVDDVPGAAMADGIVLRYHNFRPFVLPRAVYGRISDEAILTLSTRSILAVSEDMDAELAYDIASALFNNARMISEPYPLVTRELNEQLTAADLMLPLHDGARRYLDRDRPGFIERNVEVIALYFTILISAISGVIAAYRHRAQMKKDRVDNYFARLIDVREQLAKPDADKSAYRQQLVEVQREVLELLMDERITADSTLLAFVIQSNQILSEIERPGPAD